MNNILTLIKIGLITGFRSQPGKGKRKLKKPIIGVFISIYFLAMVFFMSQILQRVVEVFDMMGQRDAVIIFGLLVASVVVFMFGIFYSISSYYMAKDIPAYLSMPLKPNEITAARFSMVLVYEYLTMCLFFLPIVIGYGVAASQGIVYYLISIPVFLFLPILPLSVASIIVMFIMSFSKKSMNKDRFTMIAGILGLGMGIGLNIGFQSLARSADNSQDLQQLIMSGKLSLGESIAKYFPGLINAGKAMTEYSILHLLLFIAIAIAAFAIFMLVAKAIYFKGVLGINQQISRREFDESKSNGFTAASPVRTYFLKEIKLIIRTPMYFMNLVLIDILMPVMLIVPLFIAVDKSQLIQIRNVVMSSTSDGILVGAAFALFAFISAMNGITATTISREGKQLYIMKFIPMHYKDQLNAKLLSGMVISMGALIITLVAFSIMLEIPVITVLLMLLAGTNAVILTRITGLFIDGSNPKLKWDNEQKAVKQNMNLVFNMLVGVMVAGLAVVFMVFVSAALYINIIVFIGVFFALNYGLYKLLHMKFPSMLKRIE